MPKFYTFRNFDGTVALSKILGSFLFYRFFRAGFRHMKIVAKGIQIPDALALLVLNFYDFWGKEPLLCVVNFRSKRQPQNIVM